MIVLSIEETSRYEATKSCLVNALSSAIPKLQPGSEYCTGRSDNVNTKEKLMLAHQTAELNAK